MHMSCLLLAGVMVLSGLCLAQDSQESLGTLYAEMGCWQKAEQSFREAIRLNAGRAIHYQHLGEVLLRLNRAAEAAAVYRQALDLTQDPEQRR